MSPILSKPVPFHVVLVSPQIPPNTGNIARTCSVTGARLHLVGPLGFSLDEKALLRAGLDYWEDLDSVQYRGWPDFEERTLRGRIDKLHLFTARTERSLFSTPFEAGDFLVFGHEQRGLPPELLSRYPERCVAIPMLLGKRSLNLAVAAGIGLYRAVEAIST